MPISQHPGKKEISHKTTSQHPDRPTPNRPAPMMNMGAAVKNPLAAQPGTILHLQRMAGNRAVSGLLHPTHSPVEGRGKPIQRALDKELERMKEAKGRFLWGRTKKVIELLQAYTTYMHSKQPPTEAQEDQLMEVWGLLLEMIEDRAKKHDATSQNQLAIFLQVRREVALEMGVLGQYREIKEGKPLGKGQINTVYKVLYGAGSEAVWKADEELSPKADTAIASGISTKDSNMSNRNIAMYRLDQLLGTGVIPKTTHASWGDQVGSIMEMVKGKALGKTEYVPGTTKPMSQESVDVDLANAAIQRGLSNLQLLDAIAGQVDRHGGNIFVEQGPDGTIAGIKGIDNDFAFGINTDATGKNIIKYDRGLPKFIDMAVARRIVKITDKQVAEALHGLINDAELEKTIERFNYAKQYCAALLDYADHGITQNGKKPEGQLVENWNQQTHAQQMEQGKKDVLAGGLGLGHTTDSRSYLYNAQHDLTKVKNSISQGDTDFKLVPLFG